MYSIQPYALDLQLLVSQGLSFEIIYLLSGVNYMMIAVQKMQKLDGVRIDPLPRCVQLTFSRQMKGETCPHTVPEADLSSVQTPTWLLL